MQKLVCSLGQRAGLKETKERNLVCREASRCLLTQFSYQSVFVVVVLLLVFVLGICRFSCVSFHLSLPKGAIIWACNRWQTVWRLSRVWIRIQISDEFEFKYLTCVRLRMTFYFFFISLFKKKEVIFVHSLSTVIELDSNTKMADVLCIFLLKLRGCSDLDTLSGCPFYTGRPFQGTVL